MSLSSPGSGVDGLVLPAGSVFATPPAAFTFESWVKVSTLTGSRALAMFGDNRWDPYLSSARPAFYDFSAGGRVSTTTITANVWTHVAITYVSGTFRFYVNGVLTNSVSSTYPYAGGSFSGTARTLLRSGSVLGGFAGLVSDIRIWSAARSGAEISASYEARLAGTETGLVGYWRLDDGAGPTAADSSPGGATATIAGSGGVVWSTEEPAPFAGAPGGGTARVIAPVWIGL